MSSLDNIEIENIKQFYNSFKEDLKSDISSKNVSNKKECYIIKKPWDTELSKNFNNYNPNNYKRRYGRIKFSSSNIY